IEFTDYQDLFRKYESLTKISFDYAVVERESEIQVLRFAGCDGNTSFGINFRNLPVYTLNHGFISVRCFKDFD
ncbi:hypothetical protein, partial [Gemmiger formicilis]|uniref:hypothetical protein n=1 Tax=Gemmiger formicilis TaxID=745368 RepID=UPI0019586933